MDITNTYWTNRGWQRVILKVDDDDHTCEDVGDDFWGGDDEWDNDDDDIQTVEDLVETIDDLFDIIEELVEELDEDSPFVIEITVPEGDKKDIKEEKDNDYDRAMKGL